jgi:mannose-6-phosphate isomerase-like protein (cupin superfamily)
MVERPWGSFEVLLTETTWQCKRLTVHPGARISYQRHRFRQEHWFILSGDAMVTLEGESLHLGAGDCARIPQNARHRVANPGREVLVILEIQTGTYFGEDDIERFDDDYGRPVTETEAV